MSGFVQGDRCRFVKSHPAMNKLLKKRVGDVGTVVASQARKDDGKIDCQIKFDEPDKAYGLWWIVADRLEKIY